MAFLIVFDEPDGLQSLESIKQNEAISDEMTIVWDERTDGALSPALQAQLGGLVRVSNALQFQQSRQNQHTAAAAARTLGITTEQIAEAILLLSKTSPIYKLLRAIVVLTVNELNDVRGELAGLKARGSVAPATQAGLQAIFSQMGNTPDRTNAQAKTAILANLNSDSGDLT